MKIKKFLILALLIILITPAEASDPYNAPDGPRSTSIRSILFTFSRDST